MLLHFVSDLNVCLQITDSVVVARLLNATLVVPQLDHRSYWKDPSNFSDIFDVDWFISSVAPDVKVIKELPPSSKKFISSQMSNLRVPRKVSPHYYLTRILPILKRKQVWLPSFAVFCYGWFVPHFDTFACSLAFIIMVMA
jgi:hypothetical protein